jgi:hypothetical protein
MVSGLPPRPTDPAEPLVIRRRRPQSVTLAGALLFAAGAVGLMSSVALLVGAGSVVDDFSTDALRLGVEAEDVSGVSVAMRTVLLSTGLGALVLAMFSVYLGRGVLRRQNAARIGALVVAIGSLACGLLRTSVTAFGGTVDWDVAAGHRDPVVADQIAQAFRDAMPSWFVGLGGGLTDLQTLGYIAVAILLLAPASSEYFRTRINAPPPLTEPPV